MLKEQYKAENLYYGIVDCIVHYDMEHTAKKLVKYFIFEKLNQYFVLDLVTGKKYKLFKDQLFYINDSYRYHFYQKREMLQKKKNINPNKETYSKLNCLTIPLNQFLPNKEKKVVSKKDVMNAILNSIKFEMNDWKYFAFSESFSNALKSFVAIIDEYKVFLEKNSFDICFYNNIWLQLITIEKMLLFVKELKFYNDEVKDKIIRIHPTIFIKAEFDSKKYKFNNQSKNVEYLIEILERMLLNMKYSLIMKRDENKQKFYLQDPILSRIYKINKKLSNFRFIYKDILLKIEDYYISEFQKIVNLKLNLQMNTFDEKTILMLRDECEIKLDDIEQAISYFHIHVDDSNNEKEKKQQNFYEKYLEILRLIEKKYYLLYLTVKLIVINARNAQKILNCTMCQFFHHEWIKISENFGLEFELYGWRVPKLKEIFKLDFSPYNYYLSFYDFFSKDSSVEISEKEQKLLGKTDLKKLKHKNNFIKLIQETNQKLENLNIEESLKNIYQKELLELANYYIEYILKIKKQGNECITKKEINLESFNETTTLLEYIKKMVDIEFAFSKQKAKQDIFIKLIQETNQKLENLNIEESLKNIYQKELLELANYYIEYILKIKKERTERMMKKEINLELLNETTILLECIKKLVDIEFAFHFKEEQQDTFVKKISKK